MRVYIAGPMTGHENYNHAEFDRVARRWRAIGHTVSTPFDTNSRVWREVHGRDFDPAVDQCDYGDPLMRRMIRADMDELLQADAVVVLPGWTRSRGATAEVLVAQNAGVPVLDVYGVPVTHRVRAVVEEV